MQMPQVPKHGTDDHMGIGWHVRRLGETATLAHGGTLNGHCLLVELVPAHGLAFVVLTNHVDGWRLVQDVEQAILRRVAGVGLAPGQRIGHRGVNEAMSLHSPPLPAQPELDGVRRRLPASARRRGSGAAGRARLIVATGVGQPDAGIVFYGPDVAYAVSGAYTGMPYEFVRDAGGAVRWLRVNGRIARRAT